MSLRSAELKDVVVVGASAAGTTIVDTLRREGYDGRITLIGAEPTPAYHRPALSKGFLAGREGLEDILLHPLSCAVDQRLDVGAVSVDRSRRVVRLTDGEEIRFDALAVATGARARRLAELGAADSDAREVTVRDLDDARRLIRSLAVASRVVIVGAGVLGMELASACVDRGVDVTVLDRQPPLLAQLGPHLSDLVAGAAAGKGVRIVVDPAGVRLLGSDRCAAELGGRRFEGDLVISAVGCVPNTDWLAGLGIRRGAGVPVDDHGRFDARTVAAGDVAAFPMGSAHRRTPLWHSALEQGRVAARGLLRGAEAPPLRSARYFWTEIFGMSIRACGRLPVSGDPLVLERSDSGGVLMQWQGEDGPTTAVALDFRIPVGRLRALAASSVVPT